MGGRRLESVPDGWGVATGPPEPRPIESVDPVLARAVQDGRFAFVLLDVDGRVLNANRAATELLACDQPGLFGGKLGAVVHPDDRGWSDAELELLSAGAIDRVRQQLRLVTLDGGERWVELTVHAIGDTVAGGACAIAILEDVGDRKLRELELERLADTDPLTGLWNRRRFAAELDRHMSLNARYGPRGALLMVNIDALEQINDTHGHLAGDQAIITVAELLRAQLRASDVIARVGGDEFAVLLPGATREQAAAVASALSDATRDAPQPDGSLSVTIGIADIIAIPTDASSLLGCADNSTYEAKRSGGNGYAIDRPHDPARSKKTNHGPTPTAGNGDVHRLRLEDGSKPRIDLRTLLATVAELGAASHSLVAWELYATEQAVAGAWTTATRGGMLHRVRYDPVEREWQYGLTEPGRQRLHTISEATTGIEPV
jgi:diguanylate cyclase (GGDEF)-like protein/PAS domain S-box-containing protein